MAYHTDWFVENKPFLHPWSKFYLIMIYGLFSVFWIWFVHIILKIVLMYSSGILAHHFHIDCAGPETMDLGHSCEQDLLPPA